jgi:hypothetical protein
MRSNKLAALAAIAILAASPAIGQSAAPLSVAPAVQAGESTEGNALAGGSWLPPVLAGLIVLGGVLLAAGVFDEDDPPTSP